jgi:diacylglycerol kinase (ATP)
MVHQLVFLNSKSGNSPATQTLKAAFSASQTTWLELSRELDVRRCIEQAVNTGCKSVIAAGGDGTVNALINSLMQLVPDRRPNLGIIPLGTANDFAASLGIPDDLQAAVELIRSTEPTATDVVRIRGDGIEHFYANVAAGGNCVRASEALTDELKARWGAFSYIRGAIPVLNDMRSYRITATCDEERFCDLDSWAVLVANGRTNAGHIEVAPRASTTDGLIDVVIIRDGVVGDMVEIVARNLLGDFLECEQVVFRQVQSFHLQSDPAMRFTLDGEVFAEQPVQFNVVPGAIGIFSAPNPHPLHERKLC